MMCVFQFMYSLYWTNLIVNSKLILMTTLCHTFKSIAYLVRFGIIIYFFVTNLVLSSKHFWLPCRWLLTMQYLHKWYLTQKRSALLYKLGTIKKYNPAIGSVYTKNGSIYYKLHSDKNKQYIVNEESELALIKSENNDASQKVTSSKKTTEQLAPSSKQ